MGLWKPSSARRHSQAATDTRNQNRPVVRPVEPLERRVLMARTLEAVADADVQNVTADPRFASANFGAAETLRVRLETGDQQVSFLRFDISELSGVGHAVLRLHGGQVGTGESPPFVLVGAHPVTDLDWVEGNGESRSVDSLDTDNNPPNEIRWTNQPGSGGAVDSVHVTEEGDYLWEVTNTVRNAKAAGRTQVAFALRHNGGASAPVEFVSREGSGGQRPMLVVEENTEGPTAQIRPQDIDPAVPIRQFIVTYTDEDNIDVGTIDKDDLELVGPGQTEPLRMLDVTVNAADPKAVVATYTSEAPGGSFDPTDNGLYTAVLRNDAVRDEAGNPATGGPQSFGTLIEPPPGSTDTTPPVATVSPAPVLTIRGGERTVKVTYTDDVAVNVSTIDEDDLVVAGPGGGTLSIEDVDVIRSADDKTVTATYTIDPPGEEWDASDNGLYVVTVNAGAATDTNNNPSNAASSTFNVEIPAERPPIDPDFGGGGGVTAPFVADAAATQNDGKVILVGRRGDFSAGTSQSVVQRLNPDGSLDTSFGEGGQVVGVAGLNESFHAVIVAPDGSIVAAGRRGGDMLVARFKSNGRTENRFGDGGFRVVDLGSDNDVAFALAVEGAASNSNSGSGSGNSGSGGSGGEDGGDIVAAGTSGGAFAFARLTDRGEADLGFGDAGRVLIPRTGDNVIGAVTIDPQGRIIGAGPLANRVAVIRLTESGAPDPAFGPGGSGPGTVSIVQLATRSDLDRPDRSIGINVQDDGKVLVNNRSPGGDFAMARLTPEGVLDPTFGPGGADGDGVVTVDFGGDDDADAVITQGTGEIFALGTTDAGGPKLAIAALDAAGSLIDEFGAGGKLTIDANVTGAARELHIGDLVLRAFGTRTPDGRLVIGGSDQATRPVATNTPLRRINVPGAGSLGTFGRVAGARKATKLTFMDNDGTRVTVTMKGAGSGEAFFQDNVVDLVLTGVSSSSLTISAKGGDGRVTLRNVRTDGGLKSLSAKTSIIGGTFFVDGALGKATVGPINGTLGAAGAIGSLSVAGDVTGRVFSGADFGSDALFGGTGAADDTFGAGQIKKLSVSGSASGALFAVGLDPVDANLLDGDDRVIAGSAINSISVKRGTDPGTRFVAAAFPKSAKLPQKTVPTADSRFVTPA